MHFLKILGIIFNQQDTFLHKIWKKFPFTIFL